MIRLYKLIFLLIFSLHLNAQDSLNYRDIVKRYNQAISDINNTLLKIDSNIAMQVLSNNDDIYLKLLEIDTGTLKIFLKDNTIFQESFLRILTNPTVNDSTKDNYIKQYYAQTQWYKQQQINSGLEDCPRCFLIRKIRVIALKRINDSKLDTVKCILIDYKKVFPNNTFGLVQTLTSFPCPEYEQTLTTGPEYTFTIHYNGKEINVTKAINVGTALTDIQEVSLIIPKDFK